MAWGWAEAMLMSHTHAVLASGVQAPAGFAGVSIGLAGPMQASWKKCFVSLPSVPGLHYSCSFPLLRVSQPPIP